VIELDEVKKRVENWKQGYWEIPDNLDTSSFDFEWRPEPYDKPFVHQFGTQWQRTGGPRFVIPGHDNQVKYQDCQRAIRNPTIDDKAWRSLVTDSTMDFSWHPDDNDPPYIYIFGNQWYDVDTMPTYEYHVQDATDRKFIYDVTATLLPNKDQWDIPADISDEFDYSWIPHPHEPPMIWQFGTQWQKNGGPKYTAHNGIDCKHIDVQTATKLSSRENNRAWKVLHDIDSFDFSWHPDENEPPYNYIFGNQWYDATMMPTIMYRVKGATEVKYITDIKATLSQNYENYEIIINRKIDFDFSWVPNPHEPPFIYVFGSQHHTVIDLPCLMYKVKGATSIKYVDDIKATLLPDTSNWIIPSNIDDSNFDYSWHPSVHEDPAIFQFSTQWQKTGGPKFVYKNGTNVKYIDLQQVKTLPDADDRSWKVLKSNIHFDFSWHPDDNEPPYNYVFGNQWHSAEKMPTVIYRVKGATANKYIDSISASLLSDQTNFQNLINDEFDFDYSWCPDPFDPPFNYVFGNQWHDSKTMPTLMYTMKGATTTKYIDTITTKLKPNKERWVIPSNIDDSNFDYSWVPNPHSPPMIYQFGTQWQKTGGPQYIDGDTFNVAYVDFQTVIKTTEPNRNFRPIVPHVSFDYSWHPDSCEPPFNYVFGNQWHDATVMPTIVYRMRGATENKFVVDIKANTLPNKENWVIPDDVDDSNFDYSWVPNPHAPPMVYQFGTQWQKTGGPKYVLPGATEINYVDSLTVIKKPQSKNWKILSHIDAESFDFSWHPDDNEPPYNYVFGNQWHSAEKMPTVVYRVKGATENKYMTVLSAALLPIEDGFENVTKFDVQFDYSWKPNTSDPAYIYAFGNQWHDATVMPTLLYRAKGATEYKYMDNIIATILPSKENWVIPDDIDDSDFDYSWIPNPHAPPMIYQFGTQWQKTGGPKYVVEGGSLINYVNTQRVIKKSGPIRNFRPIVANIDFDYSWHPDESEPPFNYVFGNQWYSATVMPTIIYKVKGATRNKFVTDISATLLSNKENWMIPNDIDDSEFDYSWVPNPHAPPMIYQFGTQWQRTGGPRYTVNSSTEIKYESSQVVQKLPNVRNWRILESIDKNTFDYSWHPDDTDGNYTHVFGNKFHSAEIMPTLMYKSGQSVGNKYTSVLKADLSISTIEYEDSIFDAVMDNKFETAYAHFVKKYQPLDHNLLITNEISVHLLGNQAVVPKISKIYMYDKITDYDHVVNHNIAETPELLDIIFISNGEACAESNFEHLMKVADKFGNRVIRIAGVNGRVASQQAAAHASTTSWYFLVNAKLKVNENFDFTWQPNIYKSRRHYIFTATNAVNNLEYGHQAIVANNKKLTLNTVVRGLDFTMDSRHEVVNMNSGIGMYNSSEWDTYRTAFRECIKLKHNKDVESKKRLDIWLTVANGEFAQYSLLGAKDAIEYYDDVNGELDKLKLSYDWAWIKERFDAL